MTRRASGRHWFGWSLAALAAVGGGCGTSNEARAGAAGAAGRDAAGAAGAAGAAAAAGRDAAAPDGDAGRGGGDASFGGAAGRDAAAPDGDADARVPEGTPVGDFGAVGDGVTDDTAALASALASGDDLVFAPGHRYLVRGPLRIDADGEQRLSGEGATIVTDGVIDRLFVVDKPSGTLRCRDLDVDGERRIGGAWLLKSAFDFDGCDVRALYSESSNAIAYQLDVARPMGDATISNAVCDSIESKANGVIGDGPGAARCVYVRWQTTAPVTVRLTGSTMGNVWGDDGDVIHIAQENDVYDAPTRVIVKDSELFYGSRRVVKNFSSNTYWENVTFRSVEPGHPKLGGAVSAGMVVTSVHSGDNVSNRHVYRGCTFIGSARERRAIISAVDDVVFDACKFVGATFAIYRSGGGVCFENNQVDSSFEMYDYTTEPPLFLGPIVEVNTTPAGDYVNFSATPPAPSGSFECPRVVAEP
ncbi:MAG: glycosyl hydrolase family 28-related protein [Polyangiaceae bacterium]|nr:glycosyl hydrolase family 28-related protein [Polyangiaceae bacterium]